MNIVLSVLVLFFGCSGIAIWSYIGFVLIRDKIRKKKGLYDINITLDEKK